MNETEVFAVAVADEIGACPSWFTYNVSSGTQKVTIDQILQLKKTVVSYNISENLLASSLSNTDALPSFIEIRDLAYYFHGKPEKEFTNERPWDIQQIMRDEYNSPSDLQEILNYFHGIGTTKLADMAVDNFLKKMANRYHLIKTSLATRGDWKRFADCEVKIFNIFLKVRINGIRVAAPLINEKLNDLDGSQFQKIYELRTKYNYRGVTGSQSEISAFLSSDSKNYSEFDDVVSFLKVRRNLNEKYHLLNDLMKEYRTKKSLLSVNLVRKDRVHPNFDTFGTITSRILVDSPSLQNLQKNHRDIILPEDGHELIYLDYSCYEPSILAGLSKNKRLQELCNSGDIYSQISQQVLGDTQKRDLIKLCILAHSFGMEKDRMVALIAELLTANLSFAKELYDRIFGQFADLEDWKVDACKSLEKLDFAETLNGNRRYRNKTGPLSRSERRWAVNHVVQGTGSYILKMAIVNLQEKFPVSPILPMHDAVLLQCRSDFLKNNREKLATEMKSVFESFFPTIKIRVKDEPFYLPASKPPR